jgi:hypothetical protein
MSVEDSDEKTEEDADGGLKSTYIALYSPQHDLDTYVIPLYHEGLPLLFVLFIVLI